MLPALQIREVEFLGLRSALPAPARFSWGEAHTRNVGLIRVVTEAGLDGWGETSVTFPVWSLEERALTVREGLRPLVLGRDALDLDNLLCHLRATLGRLSALWSPVAVQATIGALDMALWDLRGKVQGQPVYRLLGGRPVPIPLYAVGFTGEPRRIGEQAAAALAAGYVAVKVRAGLGPDQDLAVVKAVRDAIGEGELLVDANMAWNRGVAEDMAGRLRPFRLRWLEEPLDCRDLEGLAWLRARAGIPIAAGENCYGVDEGRRLIEAGAVDVVMPDIARCGGLTAARAIIACARARGIPYSPHHYASDLGFAAALHLCAVEPGLTHLLRDISEWPLRQELCGSARLVDRGQGMVPSGPGLGVEVDLKVVARYRVV